MKWVFVVAFVGLLALSAIAWAISPKPIEDGRVVLTLVSDPNPARYEQIALFNRLQPRFDVRLDPGNCDQQKIIVQSIGGVGPDLFHCYSASQLSAFVRAGIAWDITDELARAGVRVDQVWPCLDPCYKYQGRIYGFPTNATANALWVDRAACVEAGIAVPKGGMTWDEFVPVAQALTRRGADGRVERFGALIDWWSWPQFVRQYGGRIYTPDGTRCVIDSPEAQRGIQVLHDLIWKHHVIPTPSEEAALASGGGWENGTLGWFRARRAAMALGGRWWLCNPAFRDDASFDLRVVEAPHGTERVFIGSGKGELINKRSPHRQEALEHLTLLAGRPYNELIDDQADALAPVESFADEERFLRDAKHPREVDNAVWRDVLAHAVPEETSEFINGSVAMRIIGAQLDWVKSDEKPVAEALAIAARRVNEEIAKSVERDPSLKARWDEARAAGGSR